MFKENDEITIFKKYQTEESPIGKVRLISFVKDGLSFILDDDTKDSQITYGIQHWLCEFIEDCYYNKGYQKTFPVRYVQHVGYVPTSNSNEDWEYEEQNYKIVDKFLEVDGEQIY